jgi:uncharacterized phage protein (TIGR02220 family)
MTVATPIGLYFFKNGQMEGFIQLHRKLIEWDWYQDIPTFKLFIHCILKANHKDKSWRGIKIQRGQFITSLGNLSNETGLTLKQVRLSLDKLTNTGELGKQTTSYNTVITVVLYEKYQTRGTQKAHKGHSMGTAGATTNNENNEIKETKESPTKVERIDFDILLKFISETTQRQFRTINKKVQQSFNARLKEGYTKGDIMNAIKNASKNQFHIDNGCQYLTPEFFSRSATLEKFSSVAKPIIKFDPNSNPVN